MPILTFLALFVSTTVNAQVCGSDSDNLKPEVIKVADCEPAIHGFFSVHGHPQLVSKLDMALASANKKKKAPQEIINAIRAIINSEEGSKNIEQLEVVKGTLKEFLAKEKMDWIGLEFSPKEVKQDILKDLLEDLWGVQRVVKPLTEKSAKVPNPLTPNEVKKILLMVIPTSVLIAHEDPDLIKDAKFVALESADLKEAHGKFKNGDDHFMSWMHPLAMKASGTLTTQNLRDLYALRSKAACQGTTISNEEIEKFIRSVKNDPNAKADKGDLDSLRSILQTINVDLSFLLKRNAAVAESVIKQTGRGIVLMGTSHGPNVSQRVREKCLNQFSPANHSTPQGKQIQQDSTKQ